MRRSSMPNEESTVSKLLGKFAPKKSKKEADLTDKQKKEAEADKIKSLSDRDGITVRAYSENRPGNVSYSPDYSADDRDLIIKNASKFLESCIVDKIGKGGIEISLVNNGCKVIASEQSKVSDDHVNIKRARCVFSVKIDTQMPGKKREILASVEYDDSKTRSDMYKVTEHFLDAKDTNKKIACNASDLTEFIRTGVTKFENSNGSSRKASRQENIGDNPYNNGRQLVIRDLSNEEVFKYKKIAVKDTSNAAETLKANGFEIQKRVLDASYTQDESIHGPVYEVIAFPSQYKEIDSVLRTAGEFKIPSTEVKNDEAPNKARGEIFKNQDQIDDPGKFPGRSSEKNAPGYKKDTPEDQAKGSEGKAYKEGEDAWTGRTEEKNREGLPAKPDRKVKEDEKSVGETHANMPGPGSSDSPKLWHNRSLDTGGTLGLGEMMKYEQYKEHRTAQINQVPPPNQTPMGTAGEGPVLGGGFGADNDQIGDLVDDEDVDIRQDPEGNVIIIAPSDKLVDLAGTTDKSVKAPMTTPENKGLPGAGAPLAASKKDAEKVPMPSKEGTEQSKFQETAESIKDNGSEMDGMAHGKSEEEGSNPKIVPTDEFKKNKPDAMAFNLSFSKAGSAMSAAQRIVVKANEFRLGRILNQNEFAHCTRLAQLMVKKGEDGYSVNVSSLPERDQFAKVMSENIREIDAAVGGSGGVVPNPEAPNVPSGTGTAMDGLTHGKTDAGDGTGGFKSGDTSEAKDNEIGGINKNPEDPNMKKEPRGPEDGMSHGQTSGGTPSVKPSQDYKSSNPVKHLTANNKDFRDELLKHLTHAESRKTPHRAFAALHEKVDGDYKKARGLIMDKFGKFEISDIQVGEELQKLDNIRSARLNVMKSAERVLSKKIKTAGSKPETHFTLEDNKDEYNHQEDDWWNRALEKDHNNPKGGMPDMDLKEDESEAYNSDHYDNSSNFVGRTVEKDGGIPAKKLHKDVRDDEGKSRDHDLYDNPDDWVGRAADKGWTAPTSNEFMLKTENKKELDLRLQDVLSLKEGDYIKANMTPVVIHKMLAVAGLNPRRSKKGHEIVEANYSPRRKFCFGTNDISIIKQTIDMRDRGLEEHEVTYFMKNEYPDVPVNVGDICSAYVYASKHKKKSGKPPRNFKNATSGRSSRGKNIREKMDARIKAAMNRKSEVSDKTLKKVLELGGLDENGERKKESPSTVEYDRSSYYFGTCDPTMVKDVLDCHEKGLKNYEIEYFLKGKYGENCRIYSYDIEEILAAYKNSSNKKKKSQYNDRSYDKDKKDDIASNMPEQKSWQKGDSSTADLEKGRSDQEGDLKKDQMPQPTVSSQEEEHQPRKQEGAANPFAVCHTTVDKDKNPEKWERCVKDVKKKNKEEGAPEIPESPKKGSMVHWAMEDNDEDDGDDDKDVEVEVEIKKEEKDVEDKKEDAQEKADDEADDDDKNNKKEAQTNEDVLNKSFRDRVTENQHNMVTHHQPEGNNVTFANNDTAYDNTGRFEKTNVESPYSVEHVVESLIHDVGHRLTGSMQEAFEGAIAGERFKRLSQRQISAIADCLKANGFDVKVPKARKDDAVVETR